MAHPCFLNISIIFFLFISNSGPGICFTIASPSSRYNPTFSLCKHRKALLKLMNQLIHKLHLHQSTPLVHQNLLYQTFATKACYH